MNTAIKPKEIPPAEFAWLMRLWAGSANIDIKGISDKLNDVGFQTVPSTVRRWYHGEHKRLPSGLILFLSRASKLPESYWKGEMDHARMTEALERVRSFRFGESYSGSTADSESLPLVKKWCLPTLTNKLRPMVLSANFCM